MGEKIIQPPFYNSGFYDTGAGGGGGSVISFFKKGKYYFGDNFGLDVENKVFTPMLNSGGGCFAHIGNLYGFNKISIGLKFQKFTTGGSKSIINYQSTNTSYTNGKIFRLSEDLSSNHRLSLEFPSSNTSWESKIYLNGYNFGDIIKINIDIEKINNTYKFVLKINDEEKINTIKNDYSNGFFSPTFFCNVIVSPSSGPSYTDLFYNDKVYLEDTFMFVDDEKYFGI